MLRCWCCKKTTTRTLCGISSRSIALWWFEFFSCQYSHYTYDISWRYVFKSFVFSNSCRISCTICFEQSFSKKYKSLLNTNPIFFMAILVLHLTKAPRAFKNIHLIIVKESLFPSVMKKSKWLICCLLNTVGSRITFQFFPCSIHMIYNFVYDTYKHVMVIKVWSLTKSIHTNTHWIQVQKKS